jgi:MFS transporter, MHS family, shikimate and dehydroshikimate transport protein
LDEIGRESLVQRTPIIQVALASFIGTALEWYDFFLYGTAAALVFNQLFFPSFAPLTGTLAAFATFSVGFLARPIGGAIFGHFGDKIGRKSMLVITLLIMGVATLLTGLLPTFEVIGFWAPVLLVSLRFLQGIAVGGEWGGAVLMATEHAPEDRRGFYGSWVQLGSPAGLLLSTGAFALVSTLPEEDLLAWGWRIPFLFSVVLIVVGLVIRIRIAETPEFRRISNEQAQARLPLVEVLRTNLRSVLLSIGVILVTSGGYYIMVTFMLAYGTEQLGLPSEVMLTGLLIATVCQIPMVLVFAALSDRIGRRVVALSAAAFTFLFSFPLFLLVNTKEPILIWLGMTLAVVGQGILYGVIAAFVSELFSTRVRYSGVSLSYQLTGVVGGGPAPFIATALLAWSGTWWPVASYLALMALISLVCVYLAADRLPTSVK